MKVKIRSEKNSDYEMIAKINDEAFNQKNESKLIKALRKNPSFIPELSLVAEKNKEIVGHLLLFPIEIKSGSIKRASLSLAPMSVVPQYQGVGIGSKLVEAGLAEAKKKGFSSVIVLGHPHYYPRFGFKPASKWHIHAPFNVPNEAFLALELIKGGLNNVSGTVEYPKEFNDV